MLFYGNWFFYVSFRDLIKFFEKMYTKNQPHMILNFLMMRVLLMRAIHVPRSSPCVSESIWWSYFIQAIVATVLAWEPTIFALSFALGDLVFWTILWPWPCEIQLINSSYLTKNFIKRMVMGMSKLPPIGNI